jgi:signal transduction histidine kinase
METIGRHLSAFKYRVENVLLGRTSNQRSRHIQDLKSVLPVIQEAIDEIHNIRVDLRPSILDVLGILAALAWFTREFRKNLSGNPNRSAHPFHGGRVP